MIHHCSYGEIHKPGGQLRGEGVIQMTILYHMYLLAISYIKKYVILQCFIEVQYRPYDEALFSKSDLEGEQNTQKISTWFMDDHYGHQAILGHN